MKMQALFRNSLNTLNVDARYNQSLHWLINSPLWQSNIKPVSVPGFFCDIAYLQKLNGEITHHPDTTYSLNLSCETGVSLESFDFFEKNKVDYSKVIYFTSIYSNLQREHMDMRKISRRTIPIDYYELQTYFFHEYFGNPHNKAYNGDNANKNYRFVYGKLIGRFSRLILTQRLTELGLLDNTYSGCIIDDSSLKEACKGAARTYLKFYKKPVDLNNMIHNIKNFGGSPDNVDYELVNLVIGNNKGFNTNHCPGYPYDHNLFTDSKFSVIPETYFSKQDEKYPMFITEKIYKAIYNLHPFVVSSTPGTLNTLKSRGYKTFSDYIDESYDDETNDKNRMEAAIKAIQQMLSCTDHAGLEEIVTHNKNNMIKNSKLTIDFINQKATEILN